MRLKNLTGLVIGRHLILDGRDYRIELTAAETKGRRRYHAAVPAELTRYMDRYLRDARPTLQLIANDGRDDWTGNRLWLGRSGESLTSKGIRRQIEVRTRAAFGKPIWPHLFRDCAVTELVDCAPEETGIAPDLLGHADPRTTKLYDRRKQLVIRSEFGSGHSAQMAAKRFDPKRDLIETAAAIRQYAGSAG